MRTWLIAAHGRLHGTLGAHVGLLTHCLRAMHTKGLSVRYAHKGGLLCALRAQGALVCALCAQGGLICALRALLSAG